ncbi:MAG: DUF3822 family protein [Flavisolibacter sp.]
MNILFTLGKGKTNADSLIMEVGPDFCSYAYLDSTKKEFEYIRYHQFEETEAETAIKNILGQIEGNFNNIRIGSCFAQALLTPQSLFKEDHALLDMVYEPMEAAYKNDKVQEWQMVTEYAIPAGIVDVILNRFPQASFFHAYTPSLKIYNGFVAQDQADIHFSTSHFRVLVKKGGQLQLAQTYTYKTPLDVVYYLLKIFYEFGLDQSEAFLIISGLVEQDSALFSELHHYFSNLHFAQAPAYGIPGNDHPQYYFTSLYNLAACAS